LLLDNFIISIIFVIAISLLYFSTFSDILDITFSTNGIQLKFLIDVKNSSYKSTSGIDCNLFSNKFKVSANTVSYFPSFARNEFIAPRIPMFLTPYTLFWLFIQPVRNLSSFTTESFSNRFSSDIFSISYCASEDTPLYIAEVNVFMTDSHNSFTIEEFEFVLSSFNLLIIIYDNFLFL